MSVFDVALEQVVTRVPEIRFVTLTDTDGIEVARKSVRTDQAAQSLASARRSSSMLCAVGNRVPAGR